MPDITSLDLFLVVPQKPKYMPATSQALQCYECASLMWMPCYYCHGRKSMARKWVQTWHNSFHKRSEV